MESNPRQMNSSERVTPEQAINEINLVDLGYELLDKLKYIILLAFLGLAIAAVYSFWIAKPQYRAVAKLYILNSKDSVVNLSDLQMGNYLAADYLEVFKTWEVNEQVKKNLGLSYSYGTLNSMIQVANKANTRTLDITATSLIPKEAMDLANEYASVASEYVQEIMGTEKPTFFSRAILPTTPISPNKSRNMILGVVLGALCACGIIILRYMTNDTIRSADDITKFTGLSVLAVVPLQTPGAETKGQQPYGRRKAV